MKKEGRKNHKKEELSGSFAAAVLLQSGAAYRPQDFAVFFNVSCEGLPGQ